MKHPNPRSSTLVVVFPVCRILKTGPFHPINRQKTGVFKAKRRANNGRNLHFWREKRALFFCLSHHPCDLQLCGMVNPYHDHEHYNHDQYHPDHDHDHPHHDNQPHLSSQTSSPQSHRDQTCQQNSAYCQAVVSTRQSAWLNRKIINEPILTH